MKKDRVAARQFWSSLDNSERWEIGDELVLGTFDWRDWLPERPSPVFLDELDEERKFWEETR